MTSAAAIVIISGQLFTRQIGNTPMITRPLEVRQSGETNYTLVVPKGCTMYNLANKSVHLYCEDRPISESVSQGVATHESVL